jgi:high-affinity iron transporter
MVLIGGAALIFGASLLTSQLQQPQQVQDQTPVVRRLAATAQLAAQEYRIGVQNGRVIAPAEVAEARLFLQESRRSAVQLPPSMGSDAVVHLDSLIRLVDRAGSPDSLDAGVGLLTSSIARRSNVVLDEIPAQAPPLARGAAVYQQSCSGCHGTSGAGNGPLAVGLAPPPADLTDRAALQDRSPLDYYRRITIGVVGTAMPAFESRLPPEDRWAVAIYASLLRLPPPAGNVPHSLQSFPETGRMSDAKLLAALHERDTSYAALARVAAVRGFRPDVSADASAQVFAAVKAQLDSAYALALSGDTSASSKAFDAYMTFERVETGVRAKNPGLASDIESAFATLRSRSAERATPAEVASLERRLDASLENAERLLGDPLSPANLFVQSFVILLREGLEAILIVGALMTFLSKMGAAHRKRDIHIGVGAAVGVSLLTALALETVFQVTPAKREALEGATMIVATVVLFYVSYWLLSKMEVAKWNHFVKSRVQNALDSGSGLALASAAFLAVYREGFETVLFYKALFLTAGQGAGTMPILGGIILGSIAMVIVYLGINRFGLRLPLKPFFGVTSAFLYYMAFVFAGKGIAELQEGGLIPTTFVSGAPRLPALGIYPTVESLVAQSILVALLGLALIWTFVVAPWRSESGQRRLSPGRAQPKDRAVVGTAPGVEVGMRAEVERMDTQLSEAPDAGSRKV